MSRKEEIIQTEKEIKKIKNQVNDNREYVISIDNHIKNVEVELKDAISVESKKINSLTTSLNNLQSNKIFNANCVFENSQYRLNLIDSIEPMPQYFTVRFKAPNSYIENSKFDIGGNLYIPKNANFEKDDIVTCEFDNINKKCFFKSGGGGINETLPPQIENFNAFSGNGKVELSWTLSDVTYLDGYIFVIKENEAPKNVNDGVKCEIGRDMNVAVIDGLKNNILYYIRCFPYNNKKQYQTEYRAISAMPKNEIPLKDLPIGSKIKFGKYQVESETPQPIVFIKADNNHYKDSNNSNIIDHVTLLTEKIVDLRGFDAMEPNNRDSDRSNYGNNRYSYSNQRQWLNSNQTNWFSKTHSTDEPPTNSGTGDYNTGYDNKKGFLNLFSKEEIGNIVPTNLVVVKNTKTDGRGSEIVNDKVFLLSKTEVGLGDENGIAEGSKFSMFSNNDSRKIGVTTQCFNNTKSTNKLSSLSNSWFWYLRTPYSSSSNLVGTVYSGGPLSCCDARNGDVGVRPALNLKSETIVSLNPDSDGCYILKL